MHVYKLIPQKDHTVSVRAGEHQRVLTLSCCRFWMATSNCASGDLMGAIISPTLPCNRKLNMVSRSLGSSDSWPFPFWHQNTMKHKRMFMSASKSLDHRRIRARRRDVALVVLAQKTPPSSGLRLQAKSKRLEKLPNQTSRSLPTKLSVYRASAIMVVGR